MQPPYLNTLDIKFKMMNKLDKLGDTLVEIFHFAALFIIGGTIAWSAAYEYLDIMKKGAADLKDILMLFIYLELGAMIGIYFKTKKLPVLFLIYIAITALTRVLAVEVKAMESIEVLYITGGILILAIAGYVLSMPDTLLSDKK